MVAEVKHCNVYVIDDPMTGHIGKRFRPVWHGQSVHELAVQFVGSEAYASINGLRIEESDNKRYRIKPDDQVILLPKVAFLPMFVAIGASTAAKAAGAIAIKAALVKAFAAIAFNVALGYVVSSIMPKPDPPTMGPIDNFSTGWSPKTFNQEGLVQGRGYGKFRAYGNIISKKTSKDSSFSETVNLTVGWGRGPWKGPVADTLLIGQRPTDNYTGVTAETRNGTLNQTAISSQDGAPVEYYPEQKIEANSSVIYTTQEDDYGDLAVVLEFPGGCYVSGYFGAMPCYGYKIEIAEKDSGSWSTLVDEEVFIANDGTRWAYYNDYHNQSKEPYTKRFVLEFKASETYTGGSPVTIERGKYYDIRVSRHNVTYYFSTQSSTPGPGSTMYYDTGSVKTNLYIVRGYALTAAEGTPTHPGTAMTAIEALLTGQIRGNLEISQVWEGRIVNTYNGTSWTLQYSNNPAWILWDLYTLPVISGDGAGTAYAIEEYEGYDHADMLPYLADYWALAQRCDQMVDDGQGGTEKSATFNGIFDTVTTVRDAIDKVCRAAGCVRIPAGNVYTVVIDQAGTPSQMFNTANISSFKRRYIPKNDLASTIEGHYWPESADYQKTTLPRTNTDAGRRNVKKTMDLVGVTSTGQADRILTKELLKNELIRSRVEFNADICAIQVRVGDNFTVQHDAVKADGAAHGRIKSVTDTDTIVLDRTFDDTTGLTSITIRTASASGGDNLTAYQISSIVVNATDTTVNLASTLAITPRKHDTVTLGSPQEYRCVKITRHDDQKRHIVAEEYHAAIHTIGTPVIPIVGRAVVASVGRPLTLSIDEIAENSYTAAVLPPVSDTPDTRNIAWSGNGTTTATWAAEDGSGALMVLYKGYYFPIEASNTTSQYIYWDSASPYEFRTSSSKSGIEPADGKWLMAENNSGTVTLVHGSGTLNNLGALASKDRIESSDVDGPLIGVAIQSSETGRRLVWDETGIHLVTTGSTGKYGTFKYDDGTKYSAGLLAWLYNTETGMPIYVGLEQTIADMHLVNRTSTPSGAAEIGDLCMVNGKLYVCTTAGTPGIWTVVGTQT